MLKLFRHGVLIFGFIILSLWFVFYLDAGEQPHYAYTKLRQELLSEIATLKDRVRDLEKLKSGDFSPSLFLPGCQAARAAGCI